YQLLINQERSFRLQGAMATTQQGMRTALEVLNGELREVAAAPSGGTSGSDIRAMSSSSITFRAFRKIGVICASPITTNTIQVRARGAGFEATDSILVLMADETWDNFSLTSAPTASTVCGGDWGTFGTGQVLATNADVMAAGAVVGSAVRGFRWMTYQLHQDGNEWLLGRHDHSTGQTDLLIGPLAAPGDGGLVFRYFDVNGNPTTTPTQVVRIEITVKGVSHTLGAGSGTYSDSLTSQIFLRNN
ncbi:MAG: hypothetical protein ACRELV_07795, partial [Longimicrobiales bacterium]